jgi:Fe-S cluster assembly protein SufD
MTPNDTVNQLSNDFKAQKTAMNGKADLPFFQLRENAMKSFENLGFPTTKHEEWKYSNLKKTLSTSYSYHSESDLTLEKLPFPDLKGNVLCFINGNFKKELSTIDTSEIEVKTFREIQLSTPDFLENYFSKHTNTTEEALTALNTALANDGVVLQIPDNTIIEKPIVIRIVADVRTENAGTMLRNLVVVGKNSEVTFVEDFQTVGSQAAFVNAVTEIYIEENARVDYYKIQNDNDASSHVGTTVAHQKDASYFYAATFTLNGGFVRNNLQLLLDGEYINSYMYGLYIPNGTQHIDNHTVVDHRKPNSESNELYKGVLMDTSKGVFNGKIFVREDAQKTNAYQNCRNVIVSDKASMNTKPQLEIWADDVKCSHGTTTGQLNDEAIFYMQARGIPKQEAIRMQLLAFAEDVVSKIKIEEIQAYLVERIEQKLLN